MAVESKKDYAFVRKKDAPLLDPPATEVGLRGWLWHNVFSSMSDFKTISSSVRSVLVGSATILMAYFCVTQLHAVIDFAILSAVWSDPEGIKGSLLDG